MPAPTNDSCATAEELVGVSGTVTADNSSWAGVWPTGEDPVFNSQHFSGGRPLWWKWTNPLDQPVDLKVTPSVGQPIIGGILSGSCAALTLDVSGAHSEFSPLFFTGHGGGDLVVQPGETVYIDVQALPNLPATSDETTEPPSTTDPVYGIFSFDWQANTVTFTDEVGAGTVVADPVATVIAASGFPLDSILACETFPVLGDQVFMAWEVDDVLYAGVCNSDGTGLVVTHIRGSGPGDQWSGIGPNEPENRVCIVFDGVAVYLGFGISFFVNDADNHCYSDSLGGGAKCAGTAITFRPSTGVKYAYEVYRWDSGAGVFNHFSEILETGTTDGPQQGFTQLAPFTTRMAASPNDPGHLYVYFGQSLRRQFKDIYQSNYPPAAVVGPDNAGCDICETTLDAAYTYADFYRLDDSGAPATLLRREEKSTVIRSLASFDPDANWELSPGSEATFTDGPWTTAPSGHYESVHYNTLALLADDGALVAASVPAYWNPGGQVASDTIQVADVATGTVIESFTYDDLGGSDPSAQLAFDHLEAGGRYLNEDTGQQERFLSTGWATTGGDVFLVHTVRSDFTAPPAVLVAADPASSQPPAFLEGIYRDPGRNWYAHDQDDQIWMYDLCAAAWVVAHNLAAESEGGTELGIQNGAWIDAELYLLNQHNRLRKYPIVHDTGVCSVAPLSSGLLSWQRR